MTDSKCTAEVYLGVDVGYFLDSTSLSSAAMSCGDHTAISALAELLDKLVFRVDYVALDIKPISGGGLDAGEYDISVPKQG